MVILVHSYSPMTFADEVRLVALGETRTAPGAHMLRWFVRVEDNGHCENGFYQDRALTLNIPKHIAEQLGGKIAAPGHSPPKSTGFVKRSIRKALDNVGTVIRERGVGMPREGWHPEDAIAEPRWVRLKDHSASSPRPIMLAVEVVGDKIFCEWQVEAGMRNRLWFHTEDIEDVTPPPDFMGHNAAIGW